MEKMIIKFCSDYSFLIAWIIIFLFAIEGRKNKEFYKYEQRIKKNKDNEFSKEFNSNIEIKNKDKIIKIICNILFVVTSIGMFITSMLYFLNVITMVNYFNPIYFFVLNTLLMFICINRRYNSITNIYIIKYTWVFLFILLYCILCYKYEFFLDLLVVLITLVVYFSFRKTKYQYVVLNLLLGINLIVFGQKFKTDEMKVIYDILFALGTGIFTTGICNIFVITEHKKKCTQERLFEITQILYDMEDVMESLFNSFHKKLKCNEDDFYYIEYEKFKLKLNEFLNKTRINICTIFNKNLTYSLEEMSKDVYNLYRNKKYFLMNNIFEEGEIEELYRLYSVPKAILNDYKGKDNINIKKHLVQLIEVYNGLFEIIPEVEDYINQFGKDRINAEYEFASMQMIWPDGKKVKTSDIYEPISKNRN